jgi:hypothetical protein
MTLWETLEQHKLKEEDLTMSTRSLTYKLPSNKHKYTCTPLKIPDVTDEYRKYFLFDYLKVTKFHLTQGIYDKWTSSKKENSFSVEGIGGVYVYYKTQHDEALVNKIDPPDGVLVTNFENPKNVKVWCASKNCTHYTELKHCNMMKTWSVTKKTSIVGLKTIKPTESALFPNINHGIFQKPKCLNEEPEQLSDTNLLDFYIGKYFFEINNKWYNLSGVLWLPLNIDTNHVFDLVNNCIPDESTSVEEFREFQKEKHQLSYAWILQKVLQLFGITYNNIGDYRSNSLKFKPTQITTIDPDRFKDEENEISIGNDKSLVRVMVDKILGSMYMFLYRKYPAFVSQIHTQLLKIVYEDVSQLLIKRHKIKSRIKVMHFFVKSDQSKFSTKPKLKKTLDQICHEIATIPLSQITNVTDPCSVNQTGYILLSKFMVIILKYKIAKLLKWKPFQYPLDLNVFITKTLEAYEKNNLAEIRCLDKKNSKPQIIPITVHLHDQCLLRVLLVIFPKENIIEYYDSTRSALALKYIKFQLFNSHFTLFVRRPSYKFVSMVTRPDMKLEQGDCLYYHIRFAVQSELNPGSKEKKDMLNNQDYKNTAHKMYMELYAAAFHWIYEYKRIISNALPKY